MFDPIATKLPSTRSVERQEILFLAHRFPYPPDRGDRIRSWNILRYLSSRANISLACTTDSVISREQLNLVRSRCRRVLVAPLPPRRRWANAGIHWLCGRSLTEGLFWSKNFAQTLDYWADVITFDHVFVYCSSMLQYAQRPRLRSIPRVVDLVDVDSQKWKDYAQQAGPIHRLIYSSEAHRIARLERQSMESSKAVLLASNAEADLLRSQIRNRRSAILGLSNGVDSEYFSAQWVDQDPCYSDRFNPTVPSELRIVFVGVLDYLPNIEGLRWFFSNIWMEVRKQIPTATVHIVGKHPNAKIQAIVDYPGVNLVGAVEDVRPYLAAANVVIAPLKIARGIQNKVLEAMSMSKPLVLTSQAAEGIDATPDKHYVVADTAEQWIQNLVALAKTPEAAMEIGEAAREFVETEFNWNNRLESLDEIFGIASQTDEQEPLVPHEVF